MSFASYVASPFSGLRSTFLGLATGFGKLTNGATNDFFLDVAQKADDILGYNNSAGQSSLGAGQVSYLTDSQLKSLIEMLSAAEINSANTQMEFQREMNQNAMDFSAEQALLDRAFQQQSAQKAMDFTADQNQKAMDFSKMMSDTSYQRAVLDLRKAGLNPILAYQNGGASAMQGSAGAGVSASGSSASGVTSSGSKANISSIASAVLNYSSSIVSNSAKLLSAVGEIIPF